MSIMTGKFRSVRRARRQRPSGVDGVIVTWDVDSSDASVCSRLRRFVFGYAVRNDERTYRYPGFVEREGVRYLGQSVLFVPSVLLGDLRFALRGLGVDHVVTNAWLGSVMPS